MSAPSTPPSSDWASTAQRETAIRTAETCVLVEVELTGPSSGSMFSHLGSLTERYGMRMYRSGPPLTADEEVRVAVAVPRAHSPREAEEVVASLLERIRRAEPPSRAGSTAA